MKLFAMLSAGLVVVAASVAPTAASADTVRVVKTTRVVTERNYVRPKPKWRNVCRTTWRNGERRRVCKRQRVRR